MRIRRQQKVAEGGGSRQELTAPGRRIGRWILASWQVSCQDFRSWDFYSFVLMEVSDTNWLFDRFEL